MKPIGLETPGQRIFAGVMVTSFVGVGVGYLGVLMDQPSVYWAGVVLAVPLIIVMIPPVILAFISFVVCPPVMLFRKLRARNRHEVSIATEAGDAEQSHSTATPEPARGAASEEADA